MSAEVSEQYSTKHGRFFLYLVFAYLAVITLPLGGNEDWAKNIGQFFIFSITLLYGLLNWKRIQIVIINNRLTVSLFIVIILWIAFQWVPLPTIILNILSPESSAAYAEVGKYSGSISLDRNATLNALLKAIAYFCVFILSLSLFHNASSMLHTLLFIIIAGTYNAFYGAYEILSGQNFSLIFDIQNGHRASGTFVYHNHFANFLMLSLSAGLGYFIATLSQRNFENKLAYGKALLLSLSEPKTTVRVCLTIMVIALVMSRSRMGNTAFFVSLCGVSLLYLFTGKNVPKSFKILVISMLVIDIFVVSAWFGMEKVADRLKATSFEAENRDEVVMDGLAMLKKFPVTGAGAGSFEYTFITYASENVKGYYHQAHNDFLQFAVEYGLPATGILGLLVIYLIFNSILVIHRTLNRKLAGISAAALMAIIGMLIHMSVDFPLETPAISSYFVIFLAMACSASNLEKKLTSSQAQFNNL